MGFSRSRIAGIRTQTAYPPFSYGPSRPARPAPVAECLKCPYALLSRGSYYADRPVKPALRRRPLLMPPKAAIGRAPNGCRSPQAQWSARGVMSALYRRGSHPISGIGCNPAAGRSSITPEGTSMTTCEVMIGKMCMKHRYPVAHTHNRCHEKIRGVRKGTMCV